MISVANDTEEERKPSKRRRVRNRDDEKHYRGVVIWDIDDTLIIAFNNALIRLAHEEGRFTDKTFLSNVEEYLLDFLDSDLHFSEVDHFKPVEHIREWENYVTTSATSSINTNISLTSLSTECAGTSKRRRFIPQTYAKLLREKYAQSRATDVNQTLASDDEPSASRPESLWIDNEKKTKWKEVLVELENLSDRWTEKAKTVLRHLNSHGCRNFVVTASEIVPAYAKLILWELSEFFDYDDVYSSVNRPKSAIFLQILEDLGRSGCFPDSMASCGDGPDEEAAARMFSIPFQRIKTSLDLFLVPGLLGSDLDLPIPEDFRDHTKT